MELMTVAPNAHPGCCSINEVLKYLPILSWATNVRDKMRRDRFETPKTEYTTSSLSCLFPLKSAKTKTIQQARYTVLCSSPRILEEERRLLVA